MKRVLLTNLMLCDFTGSELHILSIANQFKKRGFEVICAVVYSAYPMRYLAEKYGVKIIHITEEELPYKHYDIVFGQHGVVFDYLIFHNNISFKKLIMSVLSPMELFENPSYFAQDAQLVLANSQETKCKLIGDGIKEDKINVFPNYAEEEFFSNYALNVQRELKRILIVSNHLPKELMGLKSILEANKYKCDVIGKQGKKLLVTADIIKQYDLVISIGKTIQYCFAQGIPVYCYDIWGGPGYIWEKNFIQAEAYNFSGRGFERKLNDRELFEDIIEGYKQTLEQLEWLNRIAVEKYDLSKNFDETMDIIPEEEKELEYDEQVLQNLIVSNEILIREVYHRIKGNLFYTDVFYDFGNGFQEENKQIYPIVGDSTITISVFIPLGVKRIRLDPVGGVFCRCSLEKINDEQAENKIIGSNRMKKEHGKDIFYTFDPQYELQIDVQGLIDIEFSVEVVPNYKIEEMLNSFISTMKYNQIYKDMIKEKDSALVERDRLLGKQMSIIDAKSRSIQEKDSALAERDRLLRNQIDIIEEKERSIQEKDSALAERDKLLRNQIEQSVVEIGDLKTVISLQRQQLCEVYNSVYWKFTQFIKRIFKG